MRAILLWSEPWSRILAPSAHVRHPRGGSKCRGAAPRCRFLNLHSGLSKRLSTRVGARMTPMRYVVSSLVLVLCAVGSTWADAPTLEELAAGIEKVRSGPDGERIVVGHISRKLEMS